MDQDQTPIALEDGWRDMEAGIARLKRILHGVDGTSFTSQEYINLYTYVRSLARRGSPFPSRAIYILLRRAFFLHPKTPIWSDLILRCGRMIFNMCTQKPPYDYSEQLYKRYKQALEEYIKSTVRTPVS